MKLYILRHAIALDKTKWRKADSERPLTKEGIRKMRKVAKGMRRLNLKLDWILTSPYRRAHETAAIVAKEFHLKKKLRLWKSLAPAGEVKHLLRHLALDFRSRESVLVVGHEPYLGQLISVLTTGSRNAAIELDKGGLAKLSADSLTYDTCARLEWLLTPKILKKII